MVLLVQRFGELMRKLWNPRNFKAHVSPHEMLQAVVLCSKKNFQITKQGNSLVATNLSTVLYYILQIRDARYVFFSSACFSWPILFVFLK